MSRTSGPDSVHLIALESVVSRLETSEHRRRAEAAAQLQLLADAFDIAAVESRGRGEPSIPRGENAELAYRAVRAEIACAMQLGEQTAERRMTHAFQLTTQYRETFETLREGSIGEQHTVVIVDAGRVIGDDDRIETLLRRSAYEAAVLPFALEENPARLHPIARRLAEQYAETTLDERHDPARRRRRISLTDREDGMAELLAYLPAVEAHGVYDRLTRMSRALEQHEAGSASDPEQEQEQEQACRRSRDEIRADLFSDLLLSGAPERAMGRDPGSLGVDALSVEGIGAIRAHLQVTVSQSALLGQGDGEIGIDSDEIAPTEVADLAGYGPIDLGTARRLAAGAPHWNRVRFDGVGILSVDRYRPSEAMRRLLRVRDEHCRFPGCRAPVHRCDIDHTVDAAKGGATSTDNLAHLCRGHHMLKHHGGWRVRQRGAGELEWLSPTGRRYRDRPPSRVRFTASQLQGPALSPPY